MSTGTSRAGGLEAHANVLASADDQSQPSTSALQHDATVPFPELFSAETYTFPVGKLTKKMEAELLKHDVEGTRLPILRRREFVREVARDIFAKVERPGRKFLSEISSRLVKEHPSLLEKLEDGSVIGSGYGSLVSNFEHRFENLNRHSNTARTLPSPRVTSIAKKRDSYGCLQYAPEFNHDEKQLQTVIKHELKDNHDPNAEVTEATRNKMAESYNLQRHEILLSNGIAPLMIEWPFLSEKICFTDHFSTLTGIDSTQTLLKLEKHSSHIMDYLERKKGKKSYKKYDSMAMSLLHQVATFFGEEDDLLFLELEVNKELIIVGHFCL